MRRLLMAATAAAATALIGGLTQAAAASDTGGYGAGTTSECQPGTLRAALDDAGLSQAGMNHAGTFLKVTNTGDETCSFSGYAGLALETETHAAVSTTTRHGDTYFAADPGTHTVTLAAGDSAWADLVWTHAGDMRHTGYLQISPTGSNSHSTVRFRQLVDDGTLSVTAWDAERPSIG